MESQMQVGVPVEQLFWNLGQRSGVEKSVIWGYLSDCAAFRVEISGKFLGIWQKYWERRYGSPGEIQVAIAGKKLEQLVMMWFGVMILYIAGDFPRISGCLIS